MITGKKALSEKGMVRKEVNRAEEVWSGEKWRAQVLELIKDLCR